MKETNKPDSNYELVKRHEVQGTPFTVIELVDDKKIFGVLGNYRITEPMKTVAEAQTELQKITWKRILQVIGIAIEKLK